MERKEEYQALLAALERTPPPPALENCVDKARGRAKRRNLGRDWGAVLASLGGLAAAFALAVNLSVPFALACGRVPILKDLAAAVAFSPSLRQAVQNDFVQYVGQSQTLEGVTLTVDYVIADKRQATIFYHLDGSFGSVAGRPEYQALDGGKLPPSSNLAFGDAHLPGESHQAVLSFEGDTPAGLRFLFPVQGVEPVREARGEATLAPAHQRGVDETRKEPKPILFTFSFALTFDPQMIAQGEVIQLERWVELDGQRVRIESAEIYPSFLQINLDYDPDNTAWLTELEFYLEDEAGQRTERVKNGFSGHGSPDSPAMSALRQESAFFWNSKHLTLHIVSAEWLDKDRRYVTVDLDQETVEGQLPEGVRLGGVSRTGDTVEIAFFGQEPPESSESAMFFYQIASGTATAPDGTEVSARYTSHTGGEAAFLGQQLLSVPEGHFTEILTFQDCPYDSLTLALHFSRRDVAVEEPVAVTVK